MADFRTHITTSTVLGAAYGAMGVGVFHLPWEGCLISAGLCSVAGMLPDLDSDSGVPVRETLSFVAVIVPMLLIRRFAILQMTPEAMVLAGGLVYVAIRFGVGNLFRRFTVHRGMWHSIPAAVIAGLITFLLGLSTDLSMRLFKAWAVVIGYASHLILDELYSIDLSGRRVRLKKSLGTALKWRSGWGVTLLVYAKLAGLAALVWLDPTVQAYLEGRGIETPEIAREFPDWRGELPRIFRR